MSRLVVTGLLLALSICCRPAKAIILPFQPPPDDVLRAEGIDPASAPPQALRAAVLPGSTISRTGWTVAVDSFQPGDEAAKVLDGDNNSKWHTAFSPTNAPLPHTITIDMKSVYNVNGLTYLPRQDGNSNGNIGQHRIFLSTDGTNFGAAVAFGTYLDDRTLKSTSFETKPARYVRIQALTEAGNRGPWTSAAEINIYRADSFTPPPNGRGKWGPTIDFPIVPVAAAVEPKTGKVLTWSSFAPDTFSGGSGGDTETATYDPSTSVVSQRTISNTNHDMFCPGTSIDGRGRLVVTGGNNAPKTSIYDRNSNTWIAGPDMKIARGYQSSATCSDGRVFTIGGSWSGGQGGKNGEIYSPTSNTWTLLPGCPVAPMLTADVQGVYRADNHAWLFGWKSGSVFQAGPSKAMNWYGMSGSGSQRGAGNRAGDGDAMCGNAVMYDAVRGKILTVGGAPNYQGTTATRNAHVITLGNPNTTPTVTTVSAMANARIFANAVVLPSGRVFVVGGQTVGEPFSDGGAIYTPEIWDPATNAFTSVLPNSIPRTYHSVAVLLIDGTVLSGGGGLCATCSTNHFDAQVYTPQYLLTSSGAPAPRPVINTVSPESIIVGRTLTITTNSAISTVSLIRFGSTTHTVDTDQRRIPLTPRLISTNNYSVVIPNDPGIALPGYWMVFVLNSAGVPSVAKTILIRNS